MQYILNGFTHDTGFRVFAFEGIAEDRVRTAFTVKADLVLARKYGIRMQELPLLCRGVLEQRVDTGDRGAYTYTEGEMSLRSIVSAAALTASKRKGPRRVPSTTTSESDSQIQAD
jgi:hypothetical protein